MTIEEAIKAVKEIAGMSLDWDDQHYEALQMAIEELSVEAVHKPDYSYEADMVRRLKESLSAETVQGEWVRCEGEIKDWEGNIVGYFYWYECDQCGSRPPINEFTKQEWLSNFCPTCGARMKGADDETD